MIGISVYLSDINEAYIKHAANLGAKLVFTSLHIPEENLSDIDTQLPLLLKIIKENKLSLVPDISPYTFEKLGLQDNDFEGLKQMGFEYVRLDFGFEDVNKVVAIAKHFKLVLNASLVDEAYIQNLLAVDFDLSSICVMHNFYPRQDSGLDEIYFSQINQTHKKYHLETMAFVAGNVKRRLPLYEGLPTLEKHRSMNSYCAAVELRQKHGIDVVLIGDNQAKIRDLDYMADYLQNNVIAIPVSLDKHYAHLYDSPIEIRQDCAPSIIRLKIPRINHLDPYQNNSRQKGSIVIDNSLAGRYCGEIQIIKEDLPYSSRCNNIGWIHPDYTTLVEAINHNTIIKFVPLEGENNDYQ